MTPTHAAVAKTVPEPIADWQLMHAQAQTLVKSGFLPDHVNTPEKALAIMQRGRELGIPPMLALGSISIIKGKPVLAADLMAGLVYRAIDQRGDGLLDIIASTPGECVIRYRRWGQREAREYQYTWDDAVRAGADKSNPTYRAHPAAMLRARAISAVCRMAFADVVGGIYTPEEIATIPDVAEAPSELHIDAVSDAMGSPPPRFIHRDTGEIVEAELVETEPERLSDDQLARLNKVLDRLRTRYGFSDEGILTKLYNDLGVEAAYEAYTGEEAERVGKYLMEWVEQLKGKDAQTERANAAINKAKAAPYVSPLAQPVAPDDEWQAELAERSQKAVLGERAS
jgi:hypothetical protein